MSEASIWNALKRKTTLSDEAIAGLMGNLWAGSNCESCRLQGDFTGDRRVSKAYEASVAAGDLSAYGFAHDAKGWGLAQWTYFTRKANLLSYCRSIGVEIGNEEAQIDYLLAEFQNEFLSSWRKLLACTDIYEAARIVCTEYEMPAVNNVEARADYGRTIYRKFHDGAEEPEPDTGPAEPTRDEIIAQIYQLLEKLR